jgi:hypothetical protein
MRLPRAYRSLARPSSVLEPSHPPDGTATPKTLVSTIPKNRLSHAHPSVFLRIRQD